MKKPTLPEEYRGYQKPKGRKKNSIIKQRKPKKPGTYHPSPGVSVMEVDMDIIAPSDFFDPIDEASYDEAPTGGYYSVDVEEKLAAILKQEAKTKIERELKSNALLDLARNTVPEKIAMDIISVQSPGISKGPINFSTNPNKRK